MAIPKKLTDQEENWIIRDVYYSVQVDQSLNKVGMDRQEFSRYLKAYPEFALKYKEAETDSCVFIENDLLNLHKKIDNHKIARVMADVYAKVLAFRNPQRYSTRIDLNLNQNISIRHNIESANQRIAELITVKDVTPKLPK